MITRTYRKWDSMRARCYRQSHPAYRWYGGRGIGVCDRWRNSFKAFLEDMGEAPPGLWLDRIDGNKDYGPGNCRWVTPKQSATNRRKKPTVPGSLKDKARQAGLPYPLVYQRIKLHGWPELVALSTPALHGHNRSRAYKASIGRV